MRKVFGQILLWAKLFRIRQWTKNGVVFAAFFFALGDSRQDVSWKLASKAAAAAVAFGLVSSAVYVVNDWRDRAVDALHPVKRLRPLASGAIRPAAALAAAGVLAAAGLAAAWRICPAPPWPLAWILGAYLAMQALYTWELKRVAVVDVMIIALGFVMRALAGAVAVDVTISPWLLLCAFWLSLFLALCKRRHEKSRLGAAARSSLANYDKKVLDLMIAVTAATVLGSYSIYTLWPDTIAKFGTPWLGATIPFVAYGLFRYLELAYRHERAERPEEVLLTDIPLILDIVAFCIVALLVFHLRGAA